MAALYDEYGARPKIKEAPEEETRAVVEKTEEEKRAMAEISSELEQYMDIPLVVSTELGRAKTTVRELLKYGPGTVVPLDKLVGEPMEIFINGMLTARGEVVVVNERFGIRVTDVIDPMDLVRQQN
ncbi:MAG: flagellar motor switch protein FliN [Nitrospinae bacterium]|nr:flagellar motor switch protein FliN [Nitrospinota bacterium]